MALNSVFGGQEIAEQYVFQSYFDDTALQNAILLQGNNSPIVASTKKEQTVTGYSVGLHPSSETPVTIQFNGPGGYSNPAVLKPGQIVTPSTTQPFVGIRYGLPFGWLGGGVAKLVVFQANNAGTYWAGNPEVIFHRQRMQIIAPAAAPAAAPFNWPIRFPWQQAGSLQSSAVVSQVGSPSMVVVPTRTKLRLRLTTLAAPALMQMNFQATNDFDLSSTGATISTPVTFFQIPWPSFAPSGAGGDLGTEYPEIELGSDISRLGCDNGGVQLFDVSGTAALTGAFVDVVRYGTL